MALVPLARIASAPTASIQPQAVARLQAGNATQGVQMAQAIGQVGGVALQLQEKYAELNDTRNLIEAENIMRAKTQEFNTWRMDPANADESKWLPRWQEMQNETQKFVDGLKITDRARLGLSRSFGRWSDGQTISVQGDAFKQGVRRTGAALERRIKQAEDDGNDGQVSSSYDEMAKLGIATKEEAELAKYESLQRSKASRLSKAETELNTIKKDAASTWQDVRSFVEQNPDMSDSEKANILVEAENEYRLKDLSALVYQNPDHGFESAQNDFKRGVISQTQLIQLERASNSRKNEMRRDEFLGIADKIKGNKAQPGEVLSMIENGQRLTDGDKADLADMMVAPKNDPLTFSSMMNEAANFEHATDSPEYSIFLSKIDSRLESSQRSEVLARLEKKTGKTEGAFTRAFGDVFRFADDDMKNGDFGPTTGKLSDLSVELPPAVRVEVDTFKADLIKDNEERLKTEPKFADYIESKAREKWWGTQKKETRGSSYQAFEIADENGKRAALSRQVQAVQMLEAYKDANPSKTPDDLLAEYNRIVSKLRSASKLPPVAPRGGVNPVGTTIPAIDAIKLDDILKRHAKNP